MRGQMTNFRLARTPLRDLKHDFDNGSVAICYVSELLSEILEDANEYGRDVILLNLEAFEEYDWAKLKIFPGKGKKKFPHKLPSVRQIKSNHYRMIILNPSERLQKRAIELENDYNCDSEAEFYWTKDTSLTDNIKLELIKYDYWKLFDFDIKDSRFIWQAIHSWNVIIEEDGEGDDTELFLNACIEKEIAQNYIDVIFSSIFLQKLKNAPYSDMPKEYLKKIFHEIADKL